MCQQKPCVPGTCKPRRDECCCGGRTTVSLSVRGLEHGRKAGAMMKVFQKVLQKGGASGRKCWAQAVPQLLLVNTAQSAAVENRISCWAQGSAPRGGAPKTSPAPRERQAMPTLTERVSTVCADPGEQDFHLLSILNSHSIYVAPPPGSLPCCPRRSGSSSLSLPRPRHSHLTGLSSFISLSPC